MSGKAAAVALAFLAALAPAGGHATTIGACSGKLGGLGNCTEIVSFDATTNILKITLQNTSPAGNGGFLTADAFNLGAAANPDIGIVSFTGDPNFPAFILNPGAASGGGHINVSPLGGREFEIGRASCRERV